MRILNIGFDKSLAGGKGLGDAVDRHREYGRHVDGIDIIVYTTKSDGLTESFKISENVTGYPTNSRNHLNFFKDVNLIADKIYKYHPFNIVVAQDPLGAGYAAYRLKKKYGCKLQINFHGDYWENSYWKKKSLLYRFAILFSRIWVKRADGVRVVSQGIRRKLVQSGVSIEKIIVLPTPINFADFSLPKTDKVESLKKEFFGKKIILQAGRHTPEKNLESLIDNFSVVFEKNPSAILLLAGEGPLTSTLSSKVAIKKLDKRIIFLGPLTQSQLACYMAISDIFVLPSHTESFGKVLIEAALAKKPVVSTATTGAKEIVENGKSGYLVPVGDIQALADRIVELLKDPKKAKVMGEYASTLVQEKFDREIIVKGIIDFWGKML